MTGVSSPDTPSGKDRDTENFPVGSFLIRPDLRPHVWAFYRFARAADDISDNPLLPPEEKIRRLKLFGATLTDPAENGAESAVPLRESLKATGVTPQHALDLLVAFIRDATQTRTRDWSDLLDYCRYSAAPVGRHVLALHGVGASAWPANDALCSALQIINHIQDCADDYREMDRVYIPQDMLAARGARAEELSAESSSPALRATLTDMLDRMKPLLVLARTFPRQVPDLRLRLEVGVIVALAERLSALLRDRDPLCDNVKLSKPASLATALRGVCRTLCAWP